jgi:hypothetical protein
MICKALETFDALDLSPLVRLRGICVDYVSSPTAKPQPDSSNAGRQERQTKSQATRRECFLALRRRFLTKLFSGSSRRATKAVESGEFHTTRIHPLTKL